MRTKSYPIYDKYAIRPNTSIIIMPIKRPRDAKVGRLKADVEK